MIPRFSVKRNPPAPPERPVIVRFFDLIGAMMREGGAIERSAPETKSGPRRAGEARKRDAR
jgi:hypothetical protein